MASPALAFPVSVGPFTMSQVSLAGAFNAFYRLMPDCPRPDPESAENFMAGLDPHLAGMGRGDVVFCQLSPLHRITLDVETRAAAQIPADALYFAWCYPMVLTKDGPRPGSGPRADFLTYGGYVYYDSARNVVGTNGIAPAPLDTQGLMFGRRQCLPQVVADALSRQGRFQEITLQPLLAAGATHFAWIRPEEFDTVACQDGCFAYKFSDFGPGYFPVVGKAVFTQALLDEELDEEEAWAVARYPTTHIETLSIFSKRKTLQENLDDSQNMAADVASVKRDSDAAVLSYEEWQQTKEKGSLADPWVFQLRRIAGS
mmetsp:Transcript_107008/g.302562  ORF Transcript_107008/g.302562 Transcript_107008/m.302562 type:complete len:315 (-) Transcript_107008:198-1142(-)